MAKQTKRRGPAGILSRYFIDGLSGMAYGLFCTLIIGLILKQIGSLIGSRWWIGQVLVQLGTVANFATGLGIGVGVAVNLGHSKLVIFSAGVCGFIGAYAAQLTGGTMIDGSSLILSGPGDPLGAFIAALVGMEIGGLVSGRTKLDILITPFVTIITGGIVGIVAGPTLSGAMTEFGAFINRITAMQPLIMGILIAVIMGMALTLPISSAALSIIVGLNGLAGGAATVGCCCQMIGFAVASFPENGVQGFLAQGLGTSMLQVPNIVRRPLIWLPSILASAILGPLSTMVFKMTNNPSGAGMGTSGLVGQFMAWQSMAGTVSEPILLLEIVLMHFVLPGLLVWIISTAMRRSGLIKPGDMALPDLRK